MPGRENGSLTMLNCDYCSQVPSRVVLRASVTMDAVNNNAGPERNKRMEINGEIWYHGGIEKAG